MFSICCLLFIVGYCLQFITSCCQCLPLRVIAYGYLSVVGCLLCVVQSFVVSVLLLFIIIHCVYVYLYCLNFSYLLRYFSIFIIYYKLNIINYLLFPIYYVLSLILQIIFVTKNKKNKNIIINVKI